MGSSETITASAESQENTQRPGVRTREEALRYIESLRQSAGRVIGEEATRVAFISGPDGVVMTKSEEREDTQRRREHGGTTPEDKDYRKS